MTLVPLAAAPEREGLPEDFGGSVEPLALPSRELRGRGAAGRAAARPTARFRFDVRCSTANAEPRTSNVEHGSSARKRVPR
jgi:hypothetical protein